MKISIKNIATNKAKDVIQSSDTIRSNNDINGNPMYISHFLNFVPFDMKNKAAWVDSNYNLAIFEAKTFLGGKKYHTKSYGGGIKYQSYNQLQDLTSFYINSIENSFESILLDGLDFENYDIIAKTLPKKLKELKRIFELESYPNAINQKNCTNYLQGLPSVLSFEFETYKIGELFKNSYLVDNNTDNHDLDTFYWFELGNALTRLLKRSK
tara:strand:- start:47 stop:679 length:633 start_codon:yes stop_codon:yes gene_type:complete